jgi:predicted ATPase/DNA-binding SARP family transcriptional activator
VEWGVLGPLRADGSAQEQLAASGRGRDLVAVMLLRRDQAVTPEVLLDLVWSDEAGRFSASVVHTAVARLRRRLGAGVVETTGRGYRLTGSTDADRFARLLGEAADLRTAQPDVAVARLRQALGLWRGPRAYEGVRDDLVTAERSRLDTLRDGAVEQLARLLLDGVDPPDPDEAHRLAAGLVDQDPLRESAHEVVMLAAWRAGRPAAALAAYDRLRGVLRDELGIDPGASAAALHARILARDASLSRSAPRPDPPPAPAGRPAAPIPLTATVGREADLAHLERLLAQRRAVVMTGPGGVGKSRLLGETYHRASAAGADVAYLDLGHLDHADPPAVAEALARMLGLRLTDDPVASLGEALAETRGSAEPPRLLLLDEAERSAEAVAEVLQAILGRARRLRVLVSSRHDLPLAGAARLVVAPLECPPAGSDAAVISGSPAVRLLRERIADHAPDLRLDDEDAQHRLAALVRRVDGLPLALELLAGYAGTRQLSELEEVTHEPLRLRSDDVGRPERHRSLRDTLLWSLERLPPGQREVLSRLGVFAGSFDLAAAAVVGGDPRGGSAGEVQAAVRSLVRHALVQVQREPGGIRFRLLRTVRDLVLDELASSGSGAEARGRHRAWYAERWRGAPRSDALLADVRESYVDYVAALRSSLADRDRTTAADLTLTLGRLWVFTDLLGPGLRWMEVVLGSGLVNPADAARIRVVRVSLALHHDPDLVRREITAVMPVLERERDHPWLVTANVIDALERYESGHHHAAVTAARRAVDAAAHISEERQADARGVCAVAESAVDPEAALASVDAAWAAARRTGSSASMASVATNLSFALLAVGRAPDARRMLEEAAEARGPGAVPLFLLHNLAWADLACAAPERAAAGFALVVTASADGVADRRAAELYVGLGCAWAALGRPEALELVEGGLRLADLVGLTLVPWQKSLVDAALVEADLAEADLARGEVDLGAALIEEARGAEALGRAPAALPLSADGSAELVGSRLHDLVRERSVPPPPGLPSWWPRS